MSTRFYVNSPLGVGPLVLEGPEAHHLVAASRLRPGDAVCLFNGDGKEYAARVLQIGRRMAELKIEAVAAPQRELAFFLQVAAPLPKGDRSQFLIEKLTELGATSFVPLECERSVVSASDAKLEKLQRHVIEASKQCGRNVLMAIELPLAWLEHCQALGDGETGWIAHVDAAESDPTRAAGARNVRIAIGPEGGFTEAEVAAGVSRGWRPINLGPRILRVETAALLAAHLAIVKQ